VYVRRWSATRPAARSIVASGIPTHSLCQPPSGISDATSSALTRVGHLLPGEALHLLYRVRHRVVKEPPDDFHAGIVPQLVDRQVIDAAW
jgi:hypothetical protein